MPKVIHFEILVDDPDRAIAFYGKTFEWSIEKTPMPMDYWLITAGSEGEPGINGALMRRESPASGESPTAYLCTIGVPSVDEYAKRVEANGGSLITPKMPIPGVGWFAYCRDSEGNQFGILQPDESAA